MQRQNSALEDERKRAQLEVDRLKADLSIFKEVYQNELFKYQHALRLQQEKQESLCAIMPMQFTKKMLLEDLSSDGLSEAFIAGPYVRKRLQEMESLDKCIILTNRKSDEIMMSCGDKSSFLGYFHQTMDNAMRFESNNFPNIVIYCQEDVLSLRTLVARFPLSIDKFLMNSKGHVFDPCGVYPELLDAPLKIEDKPISPSVHFAFSPNNSRHSFPDLKQLPVKEDKYNRKPHR